MFDLDDSTQKALFALRDVQKSGKPMVIWLGAGISKYCGYPSWYELAEIIHSRFIKTVDGYDGKFGAQLLEDNDLLGLFSYCKQTDSKSYFECLSSNLTNKAPTILYQRVLSLLSKIKPLFIITTNIDENLESNIPSLNTYQRSNIELASKALASKTPFICKLHGTFSEIDKSIWTAEDYASVEGDVAFQKSLINITSSSSILFLGYGLRDEYILNIIKNNDSLASLLGDGPHFFVSSQAKPDDFPESVRLIKYSVDQHVDHRSAISVLDIVHSVDVNESTDTENSVSLNAIYLPDYIPSGTWSTSQVVKINTDDGANPGRSYLGAGFVSSELASLTSRSLHDLIVGLVCYDKIYLPLHSLGMLYSEIGEQIFWRMIDSDSIRFVWMIGSLTVFYNESIGFQEGLITRVSLATEPKFEEALLKQIRPLAPSAQWEEVCDRIQKVTIKLDGLALANIPQLTRSALMSPKLRSSLGIGDGVVSSKIPEWFAYPVIRVASVVEDAEVCRILGISCAKMPFGTDALANVTYGINHQQYSTSDMASYVVAGNLTANLGAIAANNPNIILNVLDFRDSSAGGSLRKETFEQLQKNEGSEFLAAVNGGLKHIFSKQVLEAARGHFNKFQYLDNSVGLWTSGNMSSDAFSSWRKRSGQILGEICAKGNLSAYSFCPCGSGDKLKFCCGNLLK